MSKALRYRIGIGMVFVSAFVVGIITITFLINTAQAIKILLNIF